MSVDGADDLILTRVRSLKSRTAYAPLRVEMHAGLLVKQHTLH